MALAIVGTHNIADLGTSENCPERNTMDKRLILSLPAEVEAAVDAYRRACEEREGYAISRQKILIKLLKKGLEVAE